MPLPNLLAEAQGVYWSTEPICINKWLSFVVHNKSNWLALPSFHGQLHQCFLNYKFQQMKRQLSNQIPKYEPWTINHTDMYFWQRKSMRHTWLMTMDHGNLEQLCQKDGNQDSTEQITAFSKKIRAKQKNRTNIQLKDRYL